MKSLMKSVLRRPYYAARREVDRFLDRESLYQQMQRQMVTQYALAALSGVKPYEDIADAGFRCYSQFEEDGIALYVLSMIGFKTRKVVEICCGNGSECMATNLILNHGFQGYLFDGDKTNIALAEKFFASKRDCYIHPPELSRAWITSENVNDLLINAGATGEVDFFSLDIDGNDYWVWQAIDVIQPRLCVFETHAAIPSNLSLTIRYDPQFNSWLEKGNDQEYRGVSLAAMVKLCREKGYRLIGAHQNGFNAFFLRDDIAPDIFPEISAETVHDNKWAKRGQERLWPLLKDMDWVEV